MGSYLSVDALQRALSDGVFARTDAPKKAAGRALGTLIELITFYLLRDWGLESSLAIERGLPEYGNSSISHNVEFTLHGILSEDVYAFPDDGSTMTSSKLLKLLPAAMIADTAARKSRTLIKGDVIRHACTFATEVDHFWNAFVSGPQAVSISKLANQPFAMFECKRVGVEEGQKKGPQTIEKAKQGAYVARTVSGIQRIARADGTVAAVFEDSDGLLSTHENYYDLIDELVSSGNGEAIRNLVLTIGVVSNHGNWFTSDTQNKEMRVLAQSYDWLLFLTDLALAEFIGMVLESTEPGFEGTRDAFARSYAASGCKNVFTKVEIDRNADAELTAFFASSQPWDKWFNVIAPANRQIDELKSQLLRLRGVSGLRGTL